MFAINRKMEYTLVLEYVPALEFWHVLKERAPLMAGAHAPFPDDSSSCLPIPSFWPKYKTSLAIFSLVRCNASISWRAVFKFSEVSVATLTFNSSNAAAFAFLVFSHVSCSAVSRSI